MVTEVIADTNYLLAHHRATDRERPRAEMIDEVLRKIKPIVHVLDCVYSELIAVLSRTCVKEEKRTQDFLKIEKELERRYRGRVIQMAYIGGLDLLERAIAVCREVAETSGVGISPHDAMLLIYAREKGIGHIVSFDEDLGRVKTLGGKRLKVTAVHDKNIGLLKRST